MFPSEFFHSYYYCAWQSKVSKQRWTLGNFFSLKLLKFHCLQQRACIYFDKFLQTVIYFLNRSTNDTIDRSFWENIRGKRICITKRQKIFNSLLKFKQDGCVSAAFYRNASQRSPWIRTQKPLDWNRAYCNCRDEKSPWKHLPSLTTNRSTPFFSWS